MLSDCGNWPGQFAGSLCRPRQSPRRPHDGLGHIVCRDSIPARAVSFRSRRRTLDSIVGPMNSIHLKHSVKERVPASLMARVSTYVADERKAGHWDGRISHQSACLTRADTSRKIRGMERSRDDGQERSFATRVESSGWVTSRGAGVPLSRPVASRYRPDGRSAAGWLDRFT